MRESEHANAREHKEYQENPDTSCFLTLQYCKLTVLNLEQFLALCIYYKFLILHE